MKRVRSQFLREWISDIDRKPLVIRGARQVGKTWMVREFAKEGKSDLFEINFEKRPELFSYFSSNDPKKIIQGLEAVFHREIHPKKAVLFLDEIQIFPELLAKLRWFAEEMQELPVIAAGSLLDFVLAKHEFSMPVGRIGYMHLEPLSFEEFLLARTGPPTLKLLQNMSCDTKIPEVLHEQYLSFFSEYAVVGGMPKAVSAWLESGSFLKVNKMHHDLLATYRDDFSKYRGRMDVDRLEDVFQAVPGVLGKKFIYQHVNPGVSSVSIKSALNLLIKAKITSRVVHSSANGIPLGSEVRSKSFKVLYLDVGLCSAILDLRPEKLLQIEDLNLVNKGAISEQVVGQLLRTLPPAYIEPKNYYWRKETPSASAEIDYLIQHNGSIVPIEVKSGKTGTLKSLHLFMQQKKLSIAVRINSDLPSLTEVNMKDHKGEPIHYKLLSIPFYLIEQLHRLLESLM